jgi:hypothetical protein
MDDKCAYLTPGQPTTTVDVFLKFPGWNSWVTVGPDEHQPRPMVAPMLPACRARPAGRPRQCESLPAAQVLGQHGSAQPRRFRLAAGPGRYQEQTRGKFALGEVTRRQVFECPSLAAATGAPNAKVMRAGDARR